MAARVGRQGIFVLNSNNIQADFAALKAKGVKIQSSLNVNPWGSDPRPKSLLLLDGRLRHTALHVVGASVPECFRLARRFAAEARWASRASRLIIAMGTLLGLLDSRHAVSRPH